MGEYAAELGLAWCVAINALVFGAGYLFSARRITTSRSQAILDAILIGYGLQYAAVGIPGTIGWLYPSVVTVTAILLATPLLVVGIKSPTKLPPIRLTLPMLAMIAIATFAGGFALAYARFQSVLPVVFNDALTYHFPASVEWLRSHRITAYQPWFFNPANAYSPLAGSIFITWLTIPINGDAVSRFVEVPALLAAAVGVYRLARELGAAPLAGVIVAAAAIVDRSLFLQCMMGKDDLFVVLFLLTAMVAMSKPRAGEPFGAARLGLAVGLLLSMKITAWLVVPTLVLAIDSPRWTWRSWSTALAVAALIAGPWYLRNWITTGNPVFPLRVGRWFPGLFTTSRSDELTDRGWRFLVGGAYSVPVAPAALLITAWIATFFVDQNWWRRPLTRAAVLGSFLGIAVFYFRSPFPEVRFITPLVAVLLALAAATSCRAAPARWAIAATAVIAIASLMTVEIPSHAELIVMMATTALEFTVVIFALAIVSTRLRPPGRILLIYLPVFSVFLAWVYVEWDAYFEAGRDVKDVLYADQSAFHDEYPAEFSMWKSVNLNTPADATVAYTNLYLTYPLIGPQQRRHLIYVPTRDGIDTMASLPYLGDGLSGEQLVKAATAATIAQPDPQAWLKRLDQSGATCLIVGLGNGITPPELAMARSNPQRFRQAFESSNAVIFTIRPD